MNKNPLSPLNSHKFAQKLLDFLKFLSSVLQILFVEIITFQIILIYIIFRKSEQDDKGFIVVIFVVDINYGTKDIIQNHRIVDRSSDCFSEHVGSISVAVGVTCWLPKPLQIDPRIDRTRAPVWTLLCTQFDYNLVEIWFNLL